MTPTNAKRVDPIALVTEAWQIFARRVWEWLGYLLLTVIVFVILELAILFAPVAVAFEIGDRKLIENQDLAMGVLTGLFVSVMLFGLLVLVGVYYIGLAGELIHHYRTGEAPHIGRTFRVGREKIFRGLGALLMGSLIVYTGLYLCILPGLWLCVPCYFALFRIADGSPSVWTALGEGFMAASRDVAGYLLLVLLLGCIELAGTLACGVGIFVAVPVMLLAMALAYRDAFEGDAIVPAHAPESGI